MSSREFARRTEIIVKISGVDISADINDYIQQLTYTDNEEDKTDDLKITLDDREGIWVKKLFSAVSKTDTNSSDCYNIGDVIDFNGGTHYVSSTATAPTGGNRTAGKAKITNIAKGALHPYHIIGGAYSEAPGNSNVYGWVDVSQISLGSSNSRGSSSSVEASAENIRLGDIVEFGGGLHYVSSTATTPTGRNRTAGKAKLTNIAEGAAHPYHVIGGAYSEASGNSNVYGWVDSNQISGVISETARKTPKGILGAEIEAAIIQKNWNSDGKDRVLNCGVFEIDSLDGSGPPGKASIKATSLPYTSTIRNEVKSRAWENIKLSAIANEIAKNNSMKCMFESDYDPYYIRREQVQISDIVFLQGLCKDAGISLKASSNILILFDAAAYEQKNAVHKIKSGEADVTSYHFSASSDDTNYSACHVVYTNPQTNETIEYTYMPKNADTNGPVLEINEKVNTREEARQLAMKRLREKNKGEISAEFSLVGDTSLVAGVTVDVEGYGMFDGKYIVESAVHNVTASGHTTQTKLRKVLEGY